MYYSNTKCLVVVFQEFHGLLMSNVAHTAIIVIYIQIGVVHSYTFEGNFQPWQLIAVVNNLVINSQL